MVNKFNDNEIKLLKKLLDNVSDKADKKMLSLIIDKMITLSDVYEDRKRLASERIVEKRKEDKWYGRSERVVQNHFNVLARKIKALLLDGKSSKARELYKQMREDAKFPRHKLQYENAIDMYLTSMEVEFLKSE